MNKLILLIALTLVFMAFPVSATTVTLTADRENLTLGESVKLHLEILPSEPVGGQFVLYKETESRKYILQVIFFKKPSPEQCLDCAGDVPVSGDLSRDFSYKPTDPGNYYAEANFGGARDKVYFTVQQETITTTTTTTTTSTSTTTSTTSTSTTTSTTSTSTTTSIPEIEPPSSGILYLALGVFLFLAVVLGAIFLFLLRSR
jgi:hypothetical protein